METQFWLYLASAAAGSIATIVVMQVWQVVTRARASIRLLKRMERP